MNEQNDGDRMQSEDSGVSQQPQQPQQSAAAGELLAAEREARGWSIEDVADHLKLAPRQVLAIEAGNYAALPPMAVTRGFIRSYAKLLKMDAAPLLASLPGSGAAPAEAAAPRKMVAAPFAESRLPTLGERRRSPKYVVAVVVLLLAAGGYWLSQNRDLLPQIPAISDTEPSSSPAASEAPSASEPAAPAAAEPAAPAGPAPVEAAPAPTSPTSQSPQAPAPAAAAAPAPQANSAPNALTASTSLSAAGTSDELVVSAREETWVEIRRVKGNNVVMSRLLKAGESEAVPVTEPLTLVIGNTAGVDLKLRGAALPLKGGSGNVSRITVK